IDAWTEAYDEIADVFIQLEKTMYEQEMWEGFAPFTITEKVEAATDIAAFTVVPANDDIDLSKLSLSAGQYITVKTDPEDSDHLALRHDSLYSATSDKGIQFAVRRDNRNEHYGLVSNHLHDYLDVGDAILLSVPAGDYELINDVIQQNVFP